MANNTTVGASISTRLVSETDHTLAGKPQDTSIRWKLRYWHDKLVKEAEERAMVAPQDVVIPPANQKRTEVSQEQRPWEMSG